MNIIINAVIPIFAIIFCGYLAGRFRFVSVSGAQALNDFVYYFALPALLYYSLSTTPIEQITNWPFISLNVIVAITCFFTAAVLARVLFQRKLPDISIYGMAASYGNTGFLGIPFVVAAFGQEAAVPAAIATFTFDIIIITFVVMSFEISASVRNKKSSYISLPFNIAKAVFQNPINASLLLGITASLLQLPIPGFIHVFTDTLGAAAGPTALFALGLGLLRERQDVRVEPSTKKEMGVLIGLKLLYMPLVMGILILFVFTIENELWATVAILLSALPIGALLNVFADKYRVMSDWAPIMILLSTLISILTLSGVLIVMENV
ncbi:AEC family transporter [Virgibacillus sp. MSP4-1]|uniref:AEC family transporter n=1 Tax=Virgibacillus sp. MSP4-1 TaxID=2700081 RepID=UPI00137C269E|nr:AEC family transporter [Virgibacillus sp. MSP4-1]QHS24315.1 AEC family transporter [Virgibacillus sp. MSP4-1]